MPTLSEKYGDPWRYQCPDCGSHAVSERVGDGRSHSYTYGSGGKEAEKAASDRRKQFYCLVCDDRYHHVYDKKTDTEVSSVG